MFGPDDPLTRSSDDNDITKEEEEGKEDDDSIQVGPIVFNYEDNI